MKTPPAGNVRRHRLFRVMICVATALVVCAPAAASNKKALTRAEKAMRAGDFQRAEQMYREMLTKDERDFEARLGLSKSLLKQRRFQDSFDHAARVLAADPLSAHAHALLGSVVLATGDFRLSIEEFRTALTLNENESMAIAGLAMIDFFENRNADCVARLRRAISIEGEEPDYIFNLGQAAARAQRYKEAADAYERFLLIAPKTDEDRRARIRGLIDFLRYLGQQQSLYDLAGDRTVLAFEDVNNRPIVKVRVNGSKEYLRFVLDTGSGMSVLSEETAKKIGIKPVARGGMARAIGGCGRFEIVYGYLNSLELGDIRVDNVPVYIRHFFDSGTQIDGYLGIAALARLITVVDYGNHRMTFVRQRNDAVDLATISDEQVNRKPSAQLSRQTGIEIPVRTTASGFLSGEVVIDGITKPLNFIIDTGATVSVLSEKAAALEEAPTFLQPDTMRVFGAAGIAENVKTALLPKLAIGNYAREKINAAVLDLEPVNETAGFQQNGILGGNFLRQFRVVFDFQRSVVRLEPLESPAPQKENQMEVTQSRL